MKDNWVWVSLCLQFGWWEELSAAAKITAALSTTVQHGSFSIEIFVKRTTNNRDRQSRRIPKTRPIVPQLIPSRSAISKP